MSQYENSSTCAAVRVLTDLLRPDGNAGVVSDINVKCNAGSWIKPLFLLTVSAIWETTHSKQRFSIHQSEQHCKILSISQRACVQQGWEDCEPAK